MNVNTDLFKRCMGKFATGITIVTTLASDGKKIGITVNSFNSVSLDPLLILFSLKKKSYFYQYLNLGISCKYNLTRVFFTKIRTSPFLIIMLLICLMRLFTFCFFAREKCKKR
jgi:hypothetical protein